jgi:hypothetical protein
MLLITNIFFQLIGTWYEINHMFHVFESTDVEPKHSVAL